MTTPTEVNLPEPATCEDCLTVAEQTYWLMRDNHTFRKLSGTPEEMVDQCMEEFDAGWTYCSLFVKNVPSKSNSVHASGAANREDFRINALAALDASRLALKEETK
ncbi:hypothetical protein J2W34_000094 [Variovorax boronicumulans]|uniref:hypothetical protein n=1 Tax=Variovorax boronicumulans TaxID=436515 RepID=UPI00278B8697|nr:hypothetical protein [Variovorax boronicumulans]MDQ0068320.1 hypothetical protein [Variovorax boronicumulans]